MKALVTGGGGFLGGALVRQLLACGDEVCSFSRESYPKLIDLGVTCHQGDLGDKEALLKAAEGSNIIFHVGAKAGIWGPYSEYYRVNVEGTHNVIRACRVLGIGRLVFTSSPSVVFDGKDQEGVDEGTPYPRYFLAHYPRTKAEAERLVLEANSETLLTVALRPHLIWGPGDNHLVPRLIARARAGQLRLVGNRANLVDSVYVDNAAHAHLLAARRLQTGSPVCGRAYFITQGEPIPFADLINKILAAAHLPPITQRIPAAVAYGAGTILELFHTTLRREDEPRMSRFLARQLATAHWFDLTAARRDLGYHPEVTLEEGMENLEKWLQDEGRELVSPPLRK